MSEPISNNLKTLLEFFIDEKNFSSGLEESQSYEDFTIGEAKEWLSTQELTPLCMCIEMDENTVRQVHSELHALCDQFGDGAPLLDFDDFDKML